MPPLALAFSLSLALAHCAPQRPIPDAGDARTDRPPPRDADPFAWPNCQLGETRCVGPGLYQECVEAGEFREVRTTNCTEQQKFCTPAVGCTPCAAGVTSCSDDGSTLVRCRDDGSANDPVMTCNTAAGEACQNGRCQGLCDRDEVQGTNIGCEYYAVDLDNAVLNAGETAASQQYAVVVSNPDERYTARVKVEWNTAPVGMPPRLSTVASAVIPPMDLEVFPLPPREVDCSTPGTFNTGTGTCLSSQAYRITSTVPVIAYQFNPLENTLMFSNDASLLVPTNSLRGDYLAMGWPQTLASRPPPIVLNPNDPTDLRGFVTVVGTQPDTHVTLTPAADILPGGPVAQRTQAGTPVTVTLGPFDVFNVETDAFLGDLTGTRILADKPVSVFAGSECSDVPAWQNLVDRKCCCDHLEAQQFPRLTLGRSYVALHTPNRTAPVRAAGAPVGVIENEPEFIRVMGAGAVPSRVRTTLPSVLGDPTSPPVEFTLNPGEARTLEAWTHFEIESDIPVSVANFMSSQTNTGIPLQYPGGDGSFVPMVPIEQWRSRYVFLTPDKYAFDHVTVVAPPGARPTLDGSPLPTNNCTVARSDGCVAMPGRPCAGAPRFEVYACQLSFPVIDPGLPYPQNVRPGQQNDGVHTVVADLPVAVMVTGFDLRVSYGYPAGTQLRPLE